MTKNAYNIILLRGTILNRTYGPYKNVYVLIFLPTIVGPIYYVPPYYENRGEIYRKTTKVGSRSTDVGVELNHS